LALDGIEKSGFLLQTDVLSRAPFWGMMEFASYKNIESTVWSHLDRVPGTRASTWIVARANTVSVG